MGVFGPRTIYCIALKDAPGCHEFLLQDDGKWVHVKETTEIGRFAFTHISVVSVNHMLVNHICVFVKHLSQQICVSHFTNAASTLPSTGRISTATCCKVSGYLNVHLWFKASEDRCKSETEAFCQRSLSQAQQDYRALLRLQADMGIAFATNQRPVGPVHVLIACQPPKAMCCREDCHLHLSLPALHLNQASERAQCAVKWDM